MSNDFLSRAKMALHDMRGRVEGGKLLMFQRTIEYAEALQAERDKYRKALEEASDWVCSCDPAYYERWLSAPDCMASLVGDDLREVLGVAPVCRANVANRKANQ